MMRPFSTEADEEVFEDNPEEYIRRDMEGSGMFFATCVSINLTI